MCGSYLATKSSRDTSCCVGSLNNSGITVKECVGFMQAQVTVSNHRAWGLKKAVQGCGQWLDQSEFRPMAYRSLFQGTQKKTRPLLAGNTPPGIRKSFVPINKIRVNMRQGKQQPSRLNKSGLELFSSTRQSGPPSTVVCSIILIGPNHS